MNDNSGGLLHTVFRTLAHVRRAPAFHPRGVWFEGTATGLRDSGFPLPSESTPVTGRMSKGVGTAGALPDVLGLAIRVPSGPGLDGPWDLALSSSGGNRVTRLLPLPAHDWTTARYGSIMPYRWHGRLRWLCAVAAPGQPPVRSSLRELAELLRTRPLQFSLLANSPDGGWQDVARLSVRTVVEPRDRISFDPVLNSPAGLEAVPAALRRIRERAYEGSRRGRRASRGADRPGGVHGR